MKSSSGQYFLSLDHVRAVAVFIVFVWHFNHFNDEHKVDPLIFPTSILTEGHTGVAIFLVLSGYLFAKLLVGKKIKYNLFLWNRFLRLAPLLGLVILLITIKLWLQNFPIADFLVDVSKGFILPTLPNGG